jgi:hypothetical protein
MTRIVVRVVIAFALIGAGWTVGRPQTTVADFELTVDAPAGRPLSSATRDATSLPMSATSSGQARTRTSSLIAVPRVAARRSTALDMSHISRHTGAALKHEDGA